MSLVHTLYNRFEHLIDDEFIMEGLRTLDKRRKKMSKWVQDNTDYDVCPECESLDLGYDYDKVYCNQCSWKEKVDVPYPNSKEGGAVANREFFPILKEIFGRRIRQEQTKTEVTKKDLQYLPLSIEEFDTGEYSPAEVEFLKERYHEYINDMDTVTANDKYLIHLLILQELELKKLYRKETVGREDLSMAKKRQIAIYNSLAEDLKQTKASRDDDGDKSLYEKVIAEFKDTDIEDLLNEATADEEEKQEYLEMSKKRRKEVGNKY